MAGGLFSSTIQESIKEGESIGRSKYGTTLAIIIAYALLHHRITVRGIWIRESNSPGLQLIDLSPCLATQMRLSTICSFSVPRVLLEYFVNTGWIEPLGNCLFHSFLFFPRF